LVLGFRVSALLRPPSAFALVFIVRHRAGFESIHAKLHLKLKKTEGGGAYGEEEEGGFEG